MYRIRKTHSGLVFLFASCLAIFSLTTLVARAGDSDPPSFSIREHVDLIEVNHYFDDTGKPVFDQLVFYNWDEQVGRFNVVAWRLLKHTTQLPQKNPSTGMYYASWHDGKSLRLLAADRLLQTWTQYDPETRERQFLPKERRADLLRLDLKRR